MGEPLFSNSSLSLENELDQDAHQLPPQALHNSKKYLVSACDFVHESRNYIPVGCLRIERYKCQVSIAAWQLCDRWRTLAHPRDIQAGSNGPFISVSLQESLFNSQYLNSFRNLHQAGWIRLEFKIRDGEYGQIRVYILPDDVGNRTVDRNDHAIRRSLARLLAALDVSNETWNARWSPFNPAILLHETLKPKHNSQVSLFNLFNTLPSPTPDCGQVHDSGARSAMKNILSGHVDGLKTQMMAYQRRSAAMMLQNEVEPGQIVDPRLRPLIDQDGSIWYFDIITSTCMRSPRMYEAARGGILAETMGYGKTLICLALILATREYSSQIPVEYSVGTIPVRSRVGSLLEMAAATIGRTGTPWKRLFSELLENEGEDYVNCVDAIRKAIGYYQIPGPTPRRVSRKPITSPPRKVYLSAATLIVVPPNLVRQWEREIEKHTTGLNVLIMSKSKDKLPPALELLEFDIILFSKQRFEQEAKDGSDDQGRRASSSRKSCSCLNSSLDGNSECDCFDVDRVYNSPLRQLHFKRLITDEGHSMGNSSSSSKTNAVIVVDFLQITSRWIVSGTPTQGLYGVDKTPTLPEVMPDPGRSAYLPNFESASASRQSAEIEQERKDLEKLGNIAKTYLKSRPWAGNNTWSQYVMQPKHGSKSHGNMACLRDTLAGMIIRHRPEDVERDVELPPLHQKIVYLEGSYQDKLSLNLFAMMINSNAVTSERKDADYLFHYRQRKALAQLVANLRQASFFWSGFTREDVQFTKELAEAYLAKDSLLITDEDKWLLTQGIITALKTLASSVWSAASSHHEMPFYVENNCGEHTREAWALDGAAENPTLMGATQLRALQKFAYTHQDVGHSVEDLKTAGRVAMEAAKASAAPLLRSSHKPPKVQRRLEEPLPELAGGLTLGNDLSPRKKVKKAMTTKALIELSESQEFEQKSSRPNQPAITLESSPDTCFVNANDNPIVQAVIELPTLSVDKSLVSAKILSTASSKLSYLIDQVVQFYKEEKIIIFYENDNVAYYIAQALEAVNVEHLIYAKTLNADRRSRYLVSFNQSSRFRCLLMDISQAAFGLDVSSASRVYFVNPVLSKQIEAQAVKRAHRIGQFKPVYVETLVLRSSIEEMIIERRQTMSSDEQKKCKTVLDDETMYDWIKNVRFLDLSFFNVSNSAQMAALETPQPVFGHENMADSVLHEPDSGLVVDFSPKTSTKGKRKRRLSESSEPTIVAGSETIPPPKRKSRKRVDFLIGYDEPATVGSSSPDLTRPDGMVSGISSREDSPSKAEKAKLAADKLWSVVKGGKSNDISRGSGENQDVSPSTSGSGVN